MDISSILSTEKTGAEEVVPHELTAAHAARVEQLMRALDLLQKEVLWPFFEPVERVRVVDNRAVSTQDIVDTIWREASKECRERIRICIGSATNARCYSRFMPAPRPHWAGLRRKLLPKAPSTPLSRALLPGLASGATATPVSPSPHLGHASVFSASGAHAPVPAPPDGAVDRWLFDAEQYRRLLVSSRSDHSTAVLTADRSSKLSCALTSSQQGRCDGAVLRHLRELTALARATLPAPRPPVEGEARGGASGGSPRTYPRGGSGGAPTRADTATREREDFIAEVVGPHQRELAALTLARCLAARQCLLGSTPTGEAAHWPWQAEAVLAATVAAALSPAQRESLDTLAALVSLALSMDAAGESNAPRHGLCAFQLVADAVADALEASGATGSCLPWLLYRLAVPGRGGGGDGRVSEPHPETRKRWLDLATQQLCACRWEELGQVQESTATRSRTSEGRDGSHAGAGAALATEGALPPHLRDIVDVLAREAAVRDVSQPESAPDGAMAGVVAHGAFIAIGHRNPYVSADAVSLVEERVASSSDLSAAACFKPYYRLAMVSMLESAWASLDALTLAQQPGVAEPRRGSSRSRSSDQAMGQRVRRASQSPHGSHRGKSGEESHAVGVYQSMRRMVSALSKHQRLQPLLALHQLVTGSPAGVGDDSQLVATAARWYRSIFGLEGRSGSRGGGGGSDVSSGLLWRELALLDAYTLMTVGHVSERAVDFDDAADGGRRRAEMPTVTPPPSSPSPFLPLGVRVAGLQATCLRHLQALDGGAAAPGAQAPVHHARGLRRLTPRTRADLTTRLQEGLRLSTKATLRLGDTAAICELYAAWPAIGGSLEVAKALRLAGNYPAAIEVLTRLFADTRRQYPLELPEGMRLVALEAVRGLGAQYAVGDRVDGHHGRHDRAPQSREGVDVARRGVRVSYEMLRTWHASLPPAVCADALLRGMLTPRSGESLVEASSVRRAAAALRELTETYPRDGLLSATVAGYVEALVGCRSTDAAAREEAMEEAWPLLAGLIRDRPEVPLLRVVLTRLTRADCYDGVAAVLQQTVLAAVGRRPCARAGGQGAGFLSDAYVQAALATFPVIALESLLANLSLVWSSMRPAAPPRYVQLRLHAVLEAALQAQIEERERTCVPWQCVLCHTWNNRFAGACRLCQASRSALVQCAACGGFGSSRDSACAVCSAAFVLADEAESEGVSGAATAIAPGGRPAHAILRSSSFRAVHALRPWRCHGCHHRNESSSSFFCASCGTVKPEMAAALQEAAYTCPGCNQRNPVAALRPWCNACGTLAPKLTDARPPGGAAAGSAPSLWYCVECHHLNPWLLTHCECCAAGRPPPGPVLASQPRGGEACVRERCGSLSHSTAAVWDGSDAVEVAPTPRLEVAWGVQTCAACGSRNALRAITCRSCDAALATGPEAQESDPVVTPPPSTRLPATVQRCIDDGMARWWAGVGAVAAEHTPRAASCVGGSVGEALGGTLAGAGVTACLHCHHPCAEPAVAAHDSLSLCPHCHALMRPASTPAELWVCLRGGCLQGNLSPEPGLAECDDVDGGPPSLSVRSSSSSCCSRCHEPRGDQVAYLWRRALTRGGVGKGRPSAATAATAPAPTAVGEANPLGYRCAAEWADGQTGGPAVGEAAAGVPRRPSPLHAVVLLPPPLGPTQQCPGCHSHLALDNLACVCPLCGCCSLATAAVSRDDRASEGFAALRLRLLLRTVHTWVRAHAVRSADAPPPVTEQALVTLLTSAIPVLRSAREELLPWQGCDVVHDMRCAVDRRIPTLELDPPPQATSQTADNEPHADGGHPTEVLHSAVAELRETVQGLCVLASLDARSLPTHLPPASARRVARIYLLAAVELVDALNRSTDYDEVGFPTLSALCMVIRPEQEEHIRTETRWAYLRDMKLQREWFTNGVACSMCLGTHGEDAPCDL